MVDLLSRADDALDLVSTVRIAKLVAMADALSVPDGGFTVDPASGADVSAGYAVSVHPECERIHSGTVTADDLFSYLVDHANTARLPGRVLGGWRDPRSGAAYLDISTVTSSMVDAQRLAARHNQIAIFDLQRDESVPMQVEFA